VTGSPTPRPLESLSKERPTGSKLEDFSAVTMRKPSAIEAPMARARRARLLGVVSGGRRQTFSQGKGLRSWSSVKMRPMEGAVKGVTPSSSRIWVRSVGESFSVAGAVAGRRQRVARSGVKIEVRRGWGMGRGYGFGDFRGFFWGDLGGGPQELMM